MTLEAYLLQNMRIPPLHPSGFANKRIDRIWKREDGLEQGNSRKESMITCRFKWKVHPIHL